MASWTLTVRLRRALNARLARAGREEGAVLPMVALMLVVIVGMAAFAIDVSSWYSDQQHLQMQADAAVLAGASKLAGDLTSCNSQSTSIKDAANDYSDASGAPNPVTSNGEAGSISGNPTVVCDSSGSYIDDTVSNTNPPTFFSGIFGVKPTISAHARVSLQQVTAEGGYDVLPYAIEQSQAVFNNQLIEIGVNKGTVKQALVCDGSGAENASSTSEMQQLQENGCPLTQRNDGSTCPAVALSPPSCLWEFTGVDEGQGFDVGHEIRFQNGQTAGVQCTNPYPIPTNNYAQYAANLTLTPGDPRVITIFVVPDGSLSASGGLIPIVGYAKFYLAGWDHDPCINKSDPDSPDGQHVGRVWGYFISYTDPESKDIQGSGPCDPNPDYAYTYNCTYTLTQ